MHRKVGVVDVSWPYANRAKNSGPVHMHKTSIIAGSEHYHAAFFTHNFTRRPIFRKTPWLRVVTQCRRLSREGRVDFVVSRFAKSVPNAYRRYLQNSLNLLRDFKMHTRTLGALVTMLVASVGVSRAGDLDINVLLS